MGKCGELSLICAKALTVVVNFTFLFIGLALVGGGVWIHVNRDSLLYMQALHIGMTHAVQYVMLSVGGMLSVIGFMGCFGACTESACFLGFCSFLCVLVVVCEIIVGCLVSVIRKELFQAMLSGMQFGLQHHYSNTAERNNKSISEVHNITTAWDLLQDKFNCCGVIGPEDYRHSVWFNLTKDADGLFVPDSCCRFSDDDANSKSHTKDTYKCQVDAILYPRNNTFQYLKTMGCKDMISQWISGSTPSLISAFCLLAVLQLVNLFSSCALLSSIRRKLSDYSWSDEEEEEMEME